MRNKNIEKNVHPPYRSIPKDAKKYKTKSRIMSTELAAGIMSTEIVPKVSKALMEMSNLPSRRTLAITTNWMRRLLLYAFGSVVLE